MQRKIVFTKINLKIVPMDLHRNDLRKVKFSKMLNEGLFFHEIIPKKSYQRVSTEHRDDKNK